MKIDYLTDKDRYFEMR